MSASPNIVLTRPHKPACGSAVDPLVSEVSWAAWRLASASPGQVTSEASVRAAASSFARMMETMWLPGRTLAFTEVASTVLAGTVHLEVSFAVGVLGAAGTASDVAAVAALIDTRLHSVGLPYRADRLDPSAVLDVPANTLRHGALIRQRTVTLETGTGDLEVLSRWNPTISPWSAIVSAVLTRPVPTRVRATVLPTEVTVTDRLVLEDAVAAAEAARRAAEDRPDLRFQAERAVATLVDLRASFSTPVLCAEIAVTSAAALPEMFVREIGACFTSEVDVIRHQGRTLVAAQRLMLGGFDIEPVPTGLADAHRLGLPLRGGLKERQLRDLVTLTESPIGWPIPAGAPIPTIPSGTLHSLPAPAALTSGLPIGTGTGGVRVHLPHEAMQRHTMLLGVTGTGKTTILASAALHDLMTGGQFLLLECHGSAADRIGAHADDLDVPVTILDAADRYTDKLQLLPRLRADGSNLGDVERAVTRICDAIVSSLPDATWAGPRWYQVARAILLFASAHGVHIADAVEWVGDAATVRSAARHPALPKTAIDTLLSLHGGKYTDADSVREWVTSKFTAFTAMTGRAIVARAGHGTSIPKLLASGRPVIVNLAELPRSDASLLGHVILAAFVDAAMTRPLDERTPLRIIVDEAQRFPVPGMQRIQTEGRKFGVSLMLATQTLSQLDPALADIASSAAVQVAFRQTPQSAGVMANQMDLSAADLKDLPDLHAYVKVTGHATCTVRVDPYPALPALRVKTPPRKKPNRARKPISAADLPRTSATKPSAPSFLDDWLAKRKQVSTRPPFVVDDLTGLVDDAASEPVDLDVDLDTEAR